MEDESYTVANKVDEKLGKAINKLQSKTRKRVRSLNSEPNIPKKDKDDKVRE